EACRLVDHDDGIVLVYHIERNFLSLRMGAHRRRHADLEAIPRFDRVFHVLYGRAAERHVTLPDQSLEAGAAQLRETAAQKAVEPKPGMALIGFRRKALGRNRHEAQQCPWY